MWSVRWGKNDFDFGFKFSFFFLLILLSRLLIKRIRSLNRMQWQTDYRLCGIQPQSLLSTQHKSTRMIWDCLRRSFQCTVHTHSVSFLTIYVWAQAANTRLSCAHKHTRKRYEHTHTNARPSTHTSTRINSLWPMPLVNNFMCDDVRCAHIYWKKKIYIYMKWKKSHTLSIGAATRRSSVICSTV